MWVSCEYVCHKYYVGVWQIGDRDNPMLLASSRTSLSIVGVWQIGERDNPMYSQVISKLQNVT